MCKKEKYEKHRNVLVFFFAFAMLVILNSQKLSLRTNGIFVGFFILFLLFKLFNLGFYCSLGLTNFFVLELPVSTKHRQEDHKYDRDRRYSLDAERRVKDLIYAKREQIASKSCRADNLNGLAKQENEYYRNANRKERYDHIISCESYYALGKQLTAHEDHVRRISKGYYVQHEIKRL